MNRRQTSFMFKVALDKWVSKNTPMVEQFGYLPYLLDSAIELLTASLRACSSCGMLKTPLRYASISFMASISGCAGGLIEGHFHTRVHRETFIPHEKPLLRLGRFPLRCSSVAGEWNERAHRFAGWRCGCTWTRRMPLDRIYICE